MLGYLLVESECQLCRANVRIVHDKRDVDRNFGATIGLQNSLTSKKDLQRSSKKLNIPLKHSMLPSFNGVILTENNLSGVMRDRSLAQLQGIREARNTCTGRRT